ncbi:response regulator [Sphingobacterium sp. BIGb0165]|uniref:response regulator n=1 Tax=Sphingobacterium sp. BIGb0165 TaxID=2940615 RepID=UPI002169CCA2|nr:response regulator [Sphingobacterium sp. BIGb0165]MCS4226087.1 signal transduction histidine kinase/DNA-binding response OmpR family regulator/CHASE3 domain sensor protein [Sphingobacterium sp. BIGb0165]
MPNKTLNNLSIGIGLSLFVLLVSSTASYLGIKEQNKHRQELTATRKIISLSNIILNSLQGAETGNRGYLLTGKENYLEPFNIALASLPVELKEIKELTEVDSAQKIRVDSLFTAAQQRLTVLKESVDIKRKGGTVSLEHLDESKSAMDKCRNIIKDIIHYEDADIDQKSTNLDNSSFITTLFIVISALLSLIITAYFYFRLRADFLKRLTLEKSLVEKDEGIARRLNLVQQITNRIATGDYNVKAEDIEDDDLGAIAKSVNRMSKSLKKSFDQLKDNDWLHMGYADLYTGLVGNKTERLLTTDAIKGLVNYIGAITGAIYIFNDEKLERSGCYGLDPKTQLYFLPGEGYVGQVFVDKELKVVNNIRTADYLVSFASGKINVPHLIFVPIISADQVLGVLEIGHGQLFTEMEVTFLTECARQLGIAIASAKGRAKIQTLLEETQVQSEELLSQHAELENLNTELEAQTLRLQSSEEELKVQHEELMQSNQELEERSRLLEDKNLLIAERNQEIQQKAEELALSTKYKSEFLANMSHELRTPLNSILLLSRLLSENNEQNLSSDQIESAKVIQSSGTSLLTLIDEILDLSKIESGKMTLEYASLNLNDISADLNNLFLPMVNEKGLVFTINIDPKVNQRFQGDRLRIDQVLRNLISNAIKFTAAGEVRLDIYEDSAAKDTLVFAVVDSGIGIPLEKQKIIFEAFQQADGSTRRKFGGTGLGLSISREIARLLGGEIRLVSEEGKGSTFLFIIPNHQVELDEVRSKEQQLVEEIHSEIEEVRELVMDDAYNPATIRIPEELPDDRNHITEGDKVILIVEDDVNFAKALLKYAHSQHYKGVVVVRGDHALPAAKKYHPQAVLLDIQLPIMDGWAVMDELKGAKETRHIPVHIMSSLEVKKESLLKGAIDFINKPVALEQMTSVFQKIESALSRSPKKVLIVEENPKHASALAYFLSSFNISLEVKDNVIDSINALGTAEVDCVILDMGVPDEMGYNTLEAIKQHEGLENLPIIIFTGKNLSKSEELKIKKYADSVVVKTAHSYQRILDEVGLFLHLIEINNSDDVRRKNNGLGALTDVLKGKKVLVADDDVRNIFSMTKALEKFQVQVIPAMDGKEALEVLNSGETIDIVLMDMMMPEMDGYETIKNIRQTPPFATLPIIAVTAKSMIGDREKCIQAGASDYISKPVDIDQLLSLLRVWLYEN